MRYLAILIFALGACSNPRPETKAPAAASDVPVLVQPTITVDGIAVFSGTGESFAVRPASEDAMVLTLKGRKVFFPSGSFKLGVQVNVALETSPWTGAEALGIAIVDAASGAPRAATDEAKPYRVTLETTPLGKGAPFFAIEDFTKDANGTRHLVPPFSTTLDGQTQAVPATVSHWLNASRARFSLRWVADETAAKASLDPVPRYVNLANVKAFPLSGTCSRDNRAVSVSPGLANILCQKGRWSAKVDMSAVADGPLTITVNHEGAVATQATLKDATAPNAILTGAPAGMTREPRWTLTVTGDDVATYQAWFGEASLDCSPDLVTYGPPVAKDEPIRLDASARVDGVYKLCVISQDRAGNRQATPNVATIDLDRVAPPAPLRLDLDPTASGAITATWVATAPRYLLVRRAGQAVAATPDDGVLYAVGDSLAPGETVVANVAGTTFTDGGLSLGTTYHYALFAVDEALNYAAPVRASGPAIDPRLWGNVSDLSNAGKVTKLRTATDGRGNALFVWSADVSGVTKLFGSKYDAASGFSAPVVLDDLAEGLTEFILAMAPDGHGMLAWSTSGSPKNVYAKRYDKDAGFQASTLIENTAESYWDDLTVNMGKNGFAVVGWKTFQSPTTNQWATVHEPGTGWGAGQVIENRAKGVAHLQPIVVDANNNVTFIIKEYDIQIRLFANRYKPGVGWSGLTALDSGVDVCGAQEGAADAAGNVFISAWCTKTNGTRELWVHRYDLAGNTWSITNKLASNWADIAAVKLNVFPGGKAMAAWMTSDGDYVNIWSSTYTPGTGWSAAAKVENQDFPIDASSRPPVYARDGQDRVLLVYTMDTLTNIQVWAVVFDPTTGWTAPRRLDQGTGTVDQISAFATSLEWHVMWSTGAKSFATRGTSIAGFATPVEVSSVVYSNPWRSSDGEVAWAIPDWAAGPGTTAYFVHRFIPGWGWRTPTRLTYPTRDTDGDDLYIVAPSTGEGILPWIHNDGTTRVLKAFVMKHGGTP